jgi:hypothetical protein
MMPVAGNLVIDGMAVTMSQLAKHADGTDGDADPGAEAFIACEQGGNVTAVVSPCGCGVFMKDGGGAGVVSC